MRRARLSHPRSLAVVLVAAGLALAGCGGGSDSGSDGPDAQQVAGAGEVSSTWPLTGLPVSGDEEAAQDHPVIVAKMDNTEASSPQIGLGSADLVVEELVEGGLTRLAAFYYSDLWLGTSIALDNYGLMRYIALATVNGLLMTVFFFAAARAVMFRRSSEATEGARE